MGSVEQVAARIVGEIVKDLANRREPDEERIGTHWETIDEEVQAKIIETWIWLTAEHIRFARSETP